MENNKGTICVQGGWKPTKGEPRVLPIYQSTTFKYDTSEQMGRLFDLEDSGYFYTRLQNPTNDAVASKICELEGGAAAMLTSSGQAANFYAVFNICEAGDHFICSSNVYGGTFNLFGVTMKKMGIDVTFVDPDISPEDLEKEFRPNTKCVFGESISNPSLVVFDFEKFSKAAHAHVECHLLLTILSQHLLIADLLNMELTLLHIQLQNIWMVTLMAVGGAIVDSGNFDWKAHADKFPGMTEPDDSYRGIVYAEKFGKAGYITKATAQVMRDLGSIPAPMNSFLLNVGLETLHLRMPKHCENALKVAKWLKNNDKVAWVNYPGLEGDKYYDLAQKYMPNGTCGVLTFGIKGGREASIKFMDNLKFVAIVTHVADARSRTSSGKSYSQTDDRRAVNRSRCTA